MHYRTVIAKSVLPNLALSIINPDHFRPNQYYPNVPENTGTFRVAPHQYSLVYPNQKGRPWPIS